MAALLACFPASAQINIVENGVNVIAGDSITEIHRYDAYMITYYLGKYPTLHQYWRDMSKSGQQMAGDYTSAGSPSFKRLLDQYSAPCFPTNLFIMMTPNGGSTTSNQFRYYLEFCATNSANGMRAGDYSNSITTGTMNYPGTKVILMGTLYRNVAGGGAADRDRSDIHASLAAQYGYAYCNLWRYLQVPFSNNVSNPLFDWFDGTHPGNSGSACIAYAELDSFGEFSGTNKIISTVTIDSTHGTAVGVTNATIGSISTTSTGGSFTWLSGRNPMALDTGLDPNGVDSVAAAIQMFPGIYTNQPYILTWSNLVNQTYTLSIDGESVTNLPASAGVLTCNLTAVTNGPIFRQLTNLLARVRIQMGVYPTNIAGNPDFNNQSPNISTIAYQSNARVFFSAGNTNQALHDLMATQETNLRLFDATNQTLATPITRTFSLAPAGSPPAPQANNETLSGVISAQGVVSLR